MHRRLPNPSSSRHVDHRHVSRADTIKVEEQVAVDEPVGEEGLDLVARREVAEAAGEGRGGEGAGAREGGDDVAVEDGEEEGGGGVGEGDGVGIWGVGGGDLGILEEGEVGEAEGLVLGGGPGLGEEGLGGEAAEVLEG